MSKKNLIKTAAALILLSVLIYGAQILIFHDSNTTFFYIFQDMAFMPVTIAIATLVVGYFIDENSKKERIERTQILTCSFFSIIGNDLRTLLEMTKTEKGCISWDKQVFVNISKVLEDNRDAMLTIASNPHLLEHETFTDLLWAVLHLREELAYREDSSEKDRAHLVLDAKRVYDLMLENWTDYEAYIKVQYPYFHKSAINQKWVNK